MAGRERSFFIFHEFFFDDLWSFLMEKMEKKTFVMETTDRKKDASIAYKDIYTQGGRNIKMNA